MQGTVGEILEAYRMAKEELYVRVQKKATEMGLESSPEVVGRSPEEWAYFLIGACER